MSFKKDHRQETIIYLALWGLLFIAPMMSLYIRSSNLGLDFEWSEVLTVWRQYTLFLVVFLIHNHLLAPMLVYKQKKIAYFGLCFAIVVIFQLYQCNHRPTPRNHEFRREMAMKGERPPLPPDHRDGDFRGPEGDMEHGPGGPEGPADKQPPLFVGQHDIVSIVILILMLGMNLGIKLYFKQRGDQKKFSELEKQSLEQQLEYLKYQINPHFFMNTLNNIHALVDIDPEKAKTSIVDLSKLMRYVLYEGNHPMVPLGRDVDFLRNYLKLMQLRYTDHVSISVSIPDELPDSLIAPMLLITFVENAFKHGVSYQQQSFVSIKLQAEDQRLLFSCSNSKKQADQTSAQPASKRISEGGVGLANVKKRLDLLYGRNYTLDIKDEAETYNVELNIPLT